MDAASKYELQLVKKELQSIIDELYAISSGVAGDFEGIGNTRCASSVTRSAKHYEDLKRKLGNMNLSEVTEEFAAKQRAEQEAKAKADAKAKAEAEAKAKEEAKAKAKAKAKAEAEAKAKAEAEAAAKAIADAKDDLIGGLLDWLF